jgi:hypothetical protein
MSKNRNEKINTTEKKPEHEERYRHRDKDLTGSNQIDKT